MSDTEYTPTLTGDVRHYFNQAVRDLGVNGYAAFDRALAAHDAQVRAEERERIAAAIHAAKPRHLTRDYTPVDQAYDNAARIARAGGGEG